MLRGIEIIRFHVEFHVERIDFTLDESRLSVEIIAFVELLAIRTIVSKGVRGASCRTSHSETCG